MARHRAPTVVMDTDTTSPKAAAARNEWATQKQSEKRSRRAQKKAVRRVRDQAAADEKSLSFEEFRRRKNVARREELVRRQPKDLRTTIEMAENYTAQTHTPNIGTQRTILPPNVEGYRKSVRIAAHFAREAITLKLRGSGPISAAGPSVVPSHDPISSASPASFFGNPGRTTAADDLAELLAKTSFGLSDEPYNNGKRRNRVARRIVRKTDHEKRKEESMKLKAEKNSKKVQGEGVPQGTQDLVGGSSGGLMPDIEALSLVDHAG